MFRTWLRSALAENSGAASESPAEDEQSCPGMARALENILSKQEQPEVLDLGQFCKSSAVYLADRGARVSMEPFEPPPPGEPASSDEHAAPDVRQPLVIRQPDQKFDLVLAWEHGDFVPPDRLDEFSAEVRRVLAPGGWLVMFARDDPSGGTARSDQPGCYQLTADDRIVRRASAGEPRMRWFHTNRTLERALSPLSVQSIKLQRNRIREFLVRKPVRT